MIELVGDALPAAPGLDLTRSSVKGLILGGFDGPGLLMAGMGSTIVSVYSGVDPAGIIAHPNLPGTLPLDASLMYARNVQTLLLLFGKGGEIKLDLEDEIIDGALLTHDGKVRHAPTQQALTGAQS